MIKGLEVLKHLKDFVLEYTENGLDRRFIIGSCDTIEKELKDFECLDNFFKKLDSKYEIDDLDYLELICQRYEKEHKALNIIVKKKVNIWDFYVDFCHELASLTYNHYVEYYEDWSEELLTEEEFNAVRGVLL